MLKGIAKRSSQYFFGLIAGKALVTISFIWLARLLMPEGLGQAIYFVTLLTITTELGTFGLNQWYQKTISSKNRTSHFTTICSARIISLIVSLFLTSVFLVTTKPFNITTSIILIICVLLESMLSITKGYYLEAKQPMKVSFQYLIKAFLLLLGVVVFHQVIDVTITASILLAATMVAIISLFPFHALQLKSYSWKKGLKALRESSAYALLLFTSLSYSQGDSVIIRLTLGSASLGFYGAAYRYLESLNLLPRAVFDNIFPEAAKKEGIHKAGLTKMLSAMLIAGLLSGAVLFLLSDFLTTGILGDAYSNSSYAVKVFSAVLVMFFVNAPVSAVVQSSHLLRSFLPWGIGNTVLNLGLNLLLVPTYGFNTAAWIMLVSETTGFIINLTFARKLYSSKKS